MLRRPSAPAAPTGAPAAGAAAAAGTVLPRRGSARTRLGGPRRRPAGLDVPVRVTAAGSAGTVETAGRVPRMRRPRGEAEPAGTPLDVRIDRHLDRLHTATPATRAGAVDDALARRDPDTASFAAIRPADLAAAPGRVATPADRPHTAELPALGALSFGR